MSSGLSHVSVTVHTSIFYMLYEANAFVSLLQDADSIIKETIHHCQDYQNVVLYGIFGHVKPLALASSMEALHSLGQHN